MDNIFTGVTLLITHYNRSNSLGRLLKSFKELDCFFEDIVVSDDGSSVSNQENLMQLQLEFPFRIIGTLNNKGLGNNLNKGLAAIVTPYTLYVQEDFVPTVLFPAHFRDALDIMNTRKELDIVQTNIKTPIGVGEPIYVNFFAPINP